MSEYFHVVITLKSDKTRAICLFSDLSIRELKSCFLRPYAKNSTIISGNKLFAFSDIHYIYIVKTENDKETSLHQLQNSSNESIDRLNSESKSAYFLLMGYGYKDEDLIYTGEDVTKQYISEPPGSGTALSKLMNVLQNP
ncbi:hypothetical protein [Ahrensia kielensis]|uniref:hypothetical protein n=1 Tax=Ahrensia kielensis TaxID=76980 RepID=UPI00036ADC32|nr:hypothetical protein [Ahrensia kielensis]